MIAATPFTPENFPHRWLPAHLELETWDKIEPWYKQLLDRPIASTEDLESWLTDIGELNGVIGQVGAKRHVAYTCQTDDPEREASYLAFVRDIEPNLKPLLNALRERYLDSPYRSGLPKTRYHVYDRSQENRRQLYREANIPRETEQDELGQQYQKLIGAMTVEFQGKERTLSQMAPFLEETDRSLREAVWTLTAKRRLADRDALDDLFDALVKLRVEIAREAGFANYVDYAYRSRERFDYGIPEVTEFHDAVEKMVVPLVRELSEERRKVMGLEVLRPWDLSVDPLGRAPLRPFENVDQLAEQTESVFTRIDPELAGQFQYMRTHGLLDLANRKGKAPGGYQTTFEDDRLPFIFMNAVGLDGDLRTLLHEGGHAFHTMASRGETMAAYRDCPIEFCEVASMAMELFGARDLGSFYNEKDANRSYRQLLEGTVSVLPWIATVDAFQHWIYMHPNHTRDERRSAWITILNRFGGGVDWTGFEDVRANLWHRQLHIFLYPFYYIEYGIAQLGALQIWRHSLSDRAGAVASYRKALGLGGSRPLPELFEAAGVPFGFAAPTIAPLVDAVRAELASLGP